MNSMAFKLALILSVLSFVGYANIASAHDTGTQALGASLGTTDLWQVTCFDDGGGNPTRLDTSVEWIGGPSAGAVSAQTIKGSFASNTTDTAFRPTSTTVAPSPTIIVNGGAGAYYVVVDKTGSGGASYLLTFHCKAGTAHTGTSYISLQSQ